jgi:hypothetical protein
VNRRTYIDTTVHITKNKIKIKKIYGHINFINCSCTKTTPIYIFI